MKIILFGITISSLKRLYQKLLEAKRNGWDKTEPHLFYYVMGVWDSRIFGICIYRNTETVPVKK